MDLLVQMSLLCEFKTIAFHASLKSFPVIEGVEMTIDDLRFCP
jgi:hypothetical protein